MRSVYIANEVNSWGGQDLLHVKSLAAQMHAVKGINLLCDDAFYHFAVHVGQPEVPAGVTVG